MRLNGLHSHPTYYDWKVKRILQDPDDMAVMNAITQPLCAAYRRKGCPAWLSRWRGIHKASQWLIDRRRRIFSAAVKAGVFASLTNKRIHYLRMCRPVGIMVLKDVLNELPFCNATWCPYCWGRLVVYDCHHRLERYLFHPGKQAGRRQELPVRTMEIHWQVSESEAADAGVDWLFSQLTKLRDKFARWTERNQATALTVSTVSPHPKQPL